MKSKIAKSFSIPGLSVRCSVVAAVAMAAVGVSLAPTKAATLEWDGPASGLWNDSANWNVISGVSTGVPASGDDLIFRNAAGGTPAVNDFANNALSLNSITVNTTQTLGQSGTNGILIGAGGVTVNPSLGSSANAFVLPVTLTTSQTWSIGSFTTINRSLSLGSTVLTKTGAGTLRIQGNGTSSAAGSRIEVQAGSLQALFNNDLPAATEIVMGGSGSATTFGILDGGNANRVSDVQSPISIAAGTTGAVTINNAVLSTATTVTLSGGLNVGTTTDADLVFSAATGSVTRITGAVTGSFTSVNNRGNVQLNGGNGEVQFLNENNSFSGVRTFGLVQGTVVIGANDPANGSSNGALGANTAAIFVGTSGSPNGSTPSFLLDGAVSTGRNVNVGNSGNSNSVVYTLGGRTPDPGVFSGGIVLNRDVQLTAAAGGSVTFSGLLNDGGLTQGVTKVGEGTVNLTRAAGNTYDGGTMISEGTLLVNNSTGSGTGTGTVTVADGAVLGGSGVISGATVVSGSLRPGNSIGTLEVGNDVTWNGSLDNAWVFELGAGETSDLLSITGTGSEFLKGTGTTFLFDFLGSAQLGTFSLISWTGTADLGGGALGTNFQLSDFSYTGLAGGNTATFGFNGSSLELTVVPEPSTYVVLIAGFLGVLVVARTRRNRQNGL